MKQAEATIHFLIFGVLQMVAECGLGQLLLLKQRMEAWLETLSMEAEREGSLAE